MHIGKIAKPTPHLKKYLLLMKQVMFNDFILNYLFLEYNIVANYLLSDLKK